MITMATIVPLATNLIETQGRSDTHDELVAVGFGMWVDLKHSGDFECVGRDAFRVMAGKRRVYLDEEMSRVWARAFEPVSSSLLAQEINVAPGAAWRKQLSGLIEAGILVPFPGDARDPGFDRFLELIPIPQGLSLGRDPNTGEKCYFTHPSNAIVEQLCREDYVVWRCFTGRASIGEAVEAASTRLAVERSTLMARLPTLLRTLLGAKMIVLDCERLRVRGERAPGVETLAVSSN